MTSIRLDGLDSIQPNSVLLKLVMLLPGLLIVISLALSKPSYAVYEIPAPDTYQCNTPNVYGAAGNFLTTAEALSAYGWNIARDFVGLNHLFISGPTVNGALGSCVADNGLLTKQSPPYDAYNVNLTSRKSCTYYKVAADGARIVPPISLGYPWSYYRADGSQELVC